MSNTKDYTLSDAKSERGRLEMQGLKLFQGPSFLSKFVRQGMKILDVGCGTGINSRYIVNHYKNVEVIGIDSNEKRINENKKIDSALNITYRQANVYDIPCPDGGFDLTFCRFLLMHLKEPQKALKEMLRVTKPGGCIVAYEAIHAGVWLSPRRPMFEKFLNIWLGKMVEQGQDPSIGLRLNDLFRKAGLNSVNIDVVAHSHTGDEPLFQDYLTNWKEHLPSLKEIIGTAFTDNEMEKMRQELSETNQNDFYVEMCAIASGIKE